MNINDFQALSRAHSLPPTGTKTIIRNTNCANCYSKAFIKIPPNTVWNEANWYKKILTKM